MEQNLNDINDTFPKVSVCIPVYNREKYIAQCIESVLLQDYENLEIIISDNCSTDGTADIIKKYLVDRRIRFYRNDENLGMNRNAELLISYAKTEWIVLLSSDDYFIDNNFISQAMQRASMSNKISVICGGYKTLREGEFNKIENRSDGTDSVFNGIEYLLRGFNGFWPRLCVVAMVINLSILRDIEINRFIFSAGDVFIFWRLCLSGDVYILSTPFLMYRYHDENFSDCKSVEDLSLKFIYDTAVPILIYNDLKNDNIIPEKILNKWFILNLVIFMLRNLSWDNFPIIHEAYNNALSKMGFSAEQFGLRPLFGKLKEIGTLEEKIYYAPYDVSFNDIGRLDHKTKSIMGGFGQNHENVFNNNGEVRNQIIENIKKELELVGRIPYHYMIKSSLEDAGLDHDDVIKFLEIFVYYKIYTSLPPELNLLSFAKILCAGSFEHINGYKFKEFKIIDNNIDIYGSGWIIDIASKTAPDKVYVALIQNDQIKYFIETSLKDRPDIAEVLGLRLSEKCGYYFAIPSYSIILGEYYIATIYIKNNIATVFDNNKKLIL